MSQDRLKSCLRREITSSNLPQVPAHVGLSQVLANNTLARPQSSFVKNRPVTQHQTSRPQVRAKSAHPRLLQANKYMHTNASTTQLQVGDKEQGIFTLSFWTGEFSRKILSNSSTNGGVGNVFMESKRNGRKRLIKAGFNVAYIAFDWKWTNSQQVWSMLWDRTWLYCTTDILSLYLSRHSQDLIIISHYCLPYNSYDDGSKNLVLDQLIIP